MRPAFAGLELTLPLSGALSLALVLFTAVKANSMDAVVSWLGLTAGTFAGAPAAFLGDRNRRFSSQIEFFSRISATMQVDRDWPNHCACSRRIGDHL